MVYKSNTGMTTQAYQGNVHSFNLVEQMKAHGLPFLEEVDGIKFQIRFDGAQPHYDEVGRTEDGYLILRPRQEIGRLRFYNQQTNRWEVADGGGHQAYFDAVKRQHQMVTTS